MFSRDPSSEHVWPTGLRPVSPFLLLALWGGALWPTGQQALPGEVMDGG